MRRAEKEIKSAAREYNKLFEIKQKIPTLKQFAKHADKPTNNWFGGDVNQLYRALGEKCPVEPVRRRYLREPAGQFAARVFATIGGTPTSWNTLASTMKDQAREIPDAIWRAHQSRVKLATLSLRYVQVREGLGREPTLKEFGPGSFQYLAPVLDPSLSEKWRLDRVGVFQPRAEMKDRINDVDDAWKIYSAAIERCLDG